LLTSSANPNRRASSADDRTSGQADDGYCPECGGLACGGAFAGRRRIASRGGFTSS
jgi:hypothetical protein